nr:hypothetical protein [Tanacetum cinerariifolium]
VPTDESEEELSWNSTDDEGDDDEGKDGDDDEEDDGDDGEEGDGDDDENDDGEEGDDDDDQEVVRDDDKDDEKGDKEEGHNEEEEEDELYRDVNINQGRGLQITQEVEDSHVTLTPISHDGMESIFETTTQMDVHNPTSVAPLPMTAPTMTPSTIATITTTSQAAILLTIFAGAVSAIPWIAQRYMDQRISKAVQVAVQLQSDKLREEAQKENDEFLKTIDENMKNIIKEKVKEQVKRRRDDDADKDEEPSAGPDQGSTRRGEGKEPDSASVPTKTTTRSTGRSTQGSQSRQTSTSESALQRNLCRPPVRWKSPHIQSLTQVLKINELYLELNGYLDCFTYSLIHISLSDPRNGRDCSSKLILAMVEGVIVGAVIGRGATEVGFCTSICVVVSKIDSIPTLNIELSMLVTNYDDMKEELLQKVQMKEELLQK